VASCVRANACMAQLYSCMQSGSWSLGVCSRPPEPDLSLLLQSHGTGLTRRNERFLYMLRSGVHKICSKPGVWWSKGDLPGCCPHLGFHMLHLRLMLLQPTYATLYLFLRAHMGLIKRTC
jgi:hypothetical protein